MDALANVTIPEIADQDCPPPAMRTKANRERRGPLPTASSTSPTTVLLYGHDDLLTRTRTLILRKAGFQVHTANTLVEADVSMLQLRPQIFILCHSVSFADATAAIQTARTLLPHMKVLVLTAVWPSLVSRRAEHVLDTSRGPEALLEKLRSLVTPTAHVH